MYTYRNRAGRVVLNHKADEALARILSIRRFARTAGIKAAATALRRRGYPLHITRWILCGDGLYLTMVMACLMNDRDIGPEWREWYNVR